MVIDLQNISLSKNNRKKFSKLIKRRHNYRSITYISAWIGLLFGIAVCLINITNVLLSRNSNATVYNGTLWKLLFNFFGYFTIQSNIIVIFAYLLFLTMFDTKMFNNRNFVLAVGIYINLTMFTYWIIMLPEWIMHKLDTYLWWSVFCSISFHLVCPIIYDIFLLAGVNYPCKNIKNPLNRLHSGLFPWVLLIYPFCYVLWVGIINFIKLPEDAFRPDLLDIIKENTYASIYNQLTNFNSKCYVVIYNDNIASFDPDTKGQFFYLLVGFPIALIFVFNFVWIISVNNHFSTPKEMMKKIYQQNLRNKSNNANIYSKYLHDFNRELNKIVKKKNKKHG